MGRRGVDASHECRLNILRARHQATRGNTLCVKDSESEFVAKSLRKEGVDAFSANGFVTNSHDIAEAMHASSSDEFSVEMIRYVVISELTNSGRLTSEDAQTTCLEVSRECQSLSSHNENAQ